MPLAQRIADATADASECGFCVWVTLFLPTIVVILPHGYIASATHTILFIHYVRLEVVVCITFAPSYEGWVFLSCTAVAVAVVHPLHGAVPVWPIFPPRTGSFLLATWLASTDVISPF